MPSSIANRGTVLRLLVCALLLAAGLNVLVRYVHAMATTSLWTDELHTIIHYSSRGPLAVLTEYHEPNNHVFFNLVNSLTPGRASVQPLRARIWSFAAVLATLAIGFLWFARRGAPEWGALFFCLLAIQTELLDLVLQARGYSFLLLFGLLASLAALEVMRGPRRRPLALLAIATVLGTWTVPTFVFFAGALWLILLVATRRRDVLAAGAASAAGVLLVYAPIVRQMVESARRFHQEFPDEFATLAAVREAFVWYLLRPLGAMTTAKTALVVACGIALVVLLAAALRRGDESAAGIAFVFGAVLIFLGACRLLKSPPTRTAAFVTAPIMFATVALLRNASRRHPARWQGALGVAALALGVRGATMVAGHPFVPWEAWMETGEILRDVFPDRMPFCVSEKPEFLAGYLPRDRKSVAKADVPAVARGEELFLDVIRVDPPQGRLDARTYVRDPVEVRVVQRRAGYQAIWFCPPERSFIVAARSPSGERIAVLTDRSLATGTGAIAPPAGAGWLELALEPGRRYRSVVLVAATDDLLAVRSLPASGRAWEAARTRHSRQVTLVSLGDRPVARVSVAPASGTGPLPAMQEAWAYAAD